MPTIEMLTQTIHDYLAQNEGENREIIERAELLRVLRVAHPDATAGMLLRAAQDFLDDCFFRGLGGGL